MARFVPDPKTSRWVVISPARVIRPHDNPTSPTATQGKCPFCPRVESLNQEVFRIGGRVGDPHWQIRVITNKFPITDYHEVIIHSPSHDADIDILPLKQVEMILQTYRLRYNYHAAAGHGQVLIFNNHDVHAGASLSHPHSQLVVVPSQIKLDAMPKEPIQNVVDRSSQFVVYCPDFSQWPYEVWIAPNRMTGNQDESENLVGTFGEITDGQITELAQILQKITRFLVGKFSSLKVKQKVLSQDETDDIPYNYYIYHGTDWYLRVIPRLVHRAGFELGTGLTVNIVDPIVAAGEYREAFEKK